LKVLFWGTSDRGKPRNRTLLEGLTAAGVDWTEIHRDVWTGVEDKSQLGRIARLGRYLRWLLAYPGLILRFLTSPKPDAVLLGYPAQIDLLILWPFARLRRVPVVADLFISLYDTTVIDRQMTRPGSLKARLIWTLEWLACRAADRLLIDTPPHARYIEELFGLPENTVGHVPVGAEADAFPPCPAPPRRERPRLLFYGQLIPLHGIATVLEAALSERGAAYDWIIVGSGQDTPIVETALGVSPPPHVTWHRWVPYEQLSAMICEANACLGIFGTSRKAASVVPNKVYQCLSSRRHVVTRASQAMEALCGTDASGLTLVQPGSADALLDGIERAAASGFPPPGAELVDSFSIDRIGAALVNEIDRATR
jgi:glycosyltransferase involved in cell wall biosynthesis